MSDSTVSGRAILVRRASGLITPIDDADRVVAAWRDGNPLKGDWTPAWDDRAKRIIAWSGNMGDDLFQSHPATWLAPGHQALLALCDALKPTLKERATKLCFHPHRRHVLSDPHACAVLLNERGTGGAGGAGGTGGAGGEGPFEVALAPHALIESSMLDDVEDHFRRSFQILGERCSLVIACDLKPADVGALQDVPLGEGVLEARVFRSLLDEFVPPETPVVIWREGDDEDSIAAQRDWLGI